MFCKMLYLNLLRLTRPGISSICRLTNSLVLGLAPHDRVGSQLETCDVIDSKKKRLCQTCFPVNSALFFSATFAQTNLGVDF